MTRRLALLTRREHTTQKVRIAGQRTLYISVHADEHPASTLGSDTSASRSKFVREKGTPVSPRTVGSPYTPAAVPGRGSQRVLPGGRITRTLAASSRSNSYANSDNTQQQRRSRKPPPSAWKPGQSGNPGGRPKVAGEVREYLPGSMAIEAIQRLRNAFCIRAMRPCRFVPRMALLDRGYGRTRAGGGAGPRCHVGALSSGVCTPTPKREDTAPACDTWPQTG